MSHRLHRQLSALEIAAAFRIQIEHFRCALGPNRAFLFGFRRLNDSMRRFFHLDLLVAARSKARVCALGLDPGWRR